MISATICPSASFWGTNAYSSCGAGVCERILGDAVAGLAAVESGGLRLTIFSTRIDRAGTAPFDRQFALHLFSP